MGNKGSSIDPNAPKQLNTQANNSKQDQNNQILLIIKDAFRNCAMNGLLSKDKFNQALAILENLNFKRLRDTPLADRLFTLFDKGNNGNISESDFITGISAIITDQQQAITYSFFAYDRDGDKLISRREFIQFLEESWKAAFRLLSEAIDVKTAGVTIKDIESWSTSKVPTLNENTSKIFTTFANGKETISFLQFKSYVLSGAFNEINAQLDQRCISIPLNLINLQS